MAGIGFLLRSHARQDNLLGLTQAYVISALASTGPWLLTVMALGCIMLIGSHVASSAEMQGFRVIIIYNFSLSLVMSGPVCAVASRYIADSLHRQDVAAVPTVMLVSLLIIYGTQLPVAVFFYYHMAHMAEELSFIAVVNFLLISTVWLITVFITALKHYSAVTWAFMSGMAVAVLASPVFSHAFAGGGMLMGFSIGMGVVAALLAARVFAEYPHTFTVPRHFMGYFWKYWEIAVGGGI